MQISENSAIDVNSLSGHPFPITVDFSVKEGFYRIFLTPIRVLEILDLLPLNTFIIFNVDTYEFDDSRPLTLAEIVNKYSTYLKKFDEETLLMEKKEIIRLLTVVPHYNFCLIDAKKDIEIDKVIQIIDCADKWNEITVIKESDSNFFLSSHDDCYLYFETNDKRLAFELISLQIKILITAVSNCSPDELEFNPEEIIKQNEFSVVIPQNPVRTNEKISWKILKGTFKEFVYKEKITESNFDLVYFENSKEIKIEKVRSYKTSD